MDPSLMHDARLDGFSEPPRFFEALIEFQKMCFAKFIYDEDILVAARRCGGLLEASINTRTSDGHRWYCAFTFQRGNSQVCLLFPFRGGSESPQNVSTPRYPTVYIQGSLDENDVIELLQELESHLMQGIAEKRRAAQEQRRA